MLEKLEFNCNLYRYRLENDEQLLLYNVKSGQIYIIKGNPQKFLLDKINNKNQNIIIENKYIEFFIKNNVLEVLK